MSTPPARHTGEKRQIIACPECDYRPTPLDRWSCLPRCGTSFHTFWTRGTCPGCGLQWPWTQCPACQKRSPHERWYRVPEGSEQDEALSVQG